MPQMSPLWWLLLFITFSFTLIMFFLLNYFMIIKTPFTSLKHTSKNLPFKSLTWMW
uniref:ATP synthase complex subunit 8 n=1 Tax=Elimaea cheni TaxID=488323 RepID=D8WUR1_9ORTH|nr:ATP synthase F0 subunit 8 [Elimaea cheni]